MSTRPPTCPPASTLALSVLAILAILATGCGTGSVGNGDETPEAQVQRRIAGVESSHRDDTAFVRIDDDEWHVVQSGDRIRTDTSGEGWVRIQDCMLIYIFQDSGLVKATCPKSSYNGGNVVCSLGGTSVFNNQCSSQILIQTDSAELLLKGTWFSVTYLPERQLTLVLVLDGAVGSRPVANAETFLLGVSTDVGSGHFWFTTPGVQADAVAGLSARDAHPLDQLGPLVEELGIGRWIDRLRERAASDRVPFPNLSVGPTPTSEPPMPTAPPEATATVAMDTTPPVIERVTLSPERVVAGDDVRLAVEASDDDSGLSRVELWSARGMVDQCTAMPCTFRLGRFEPGTVKFEVRAYDNAGNFEPRPVEFDVAANKPDLGVRMFEVTGDVTYNDAGHITVPVRVVIENTGPVAAGPFKVSIDYIDARSRFVVPFTVKGERSIYYPDLDGLAAGESVELRGTVSSPFWTVGQEISLVVTVDSCSGDELSLPYCRVDESDEKNNDSAGLPVTLKPINAIK